MLSIIEEYNDNIALPELALDKVDILPEASSRRHIKKCNAELQRLLNKGPC